LVEEEKEELGGKSVVAAVEGYIRQRKREEGSRNKRRWRGILAQGSRSSSVCLISNSYRCYILRKSVNNQVQSRRDQYVINRLYNYESISRYLKMIK
jgi:hypothetical protein